MIITGKITLFNITIDIVHKLIAKQFPEYTNLPITPVEKQGHDNFTYRLGDSMLIRMHTAECYVFAVKKSLLFYQRSHHI